MSVELFASPAFFAEAACRGYAELHGGPARDKLFFPRRGHVNGAAKAICADCPVRIECLEYALVTGANHGIWGGLSERERKRIRHQRRIAAREVVMAS